MSDPIKADLGDWALTVLAGILIGIITGLSTAMQWFRNSKARIYQRLDAMDGTITRRTEVIQVDSDRRQDKIETQLRDIWKVENSHAVQLSVLTSCQANIAATLVELKKDGDKQNDKLDELLREQRRT